MGTALRSEVSTTVVRYELILPTNAVEVTKAIGWALADFCAHYGLESSDRLPDDVITVEATDEQLILSWVKS